LLAQIFAQLFQPSSSATIDRKEKTPMSDGHNPNERQIVLPSGSVATARAGRGRDLIQAQRAVGKTAESTALLQALVAILCKIDGKDVVYEDVLDMPVADVLILEAEVLGNFPMGQASSLSSPTQPASPDSSISASVPPSSVK
jgi:hypothetical protein